MPNEMVALSFPVAYPNSHRNSDLTTLSSPCFCLTAGGGLGGRGMSEYSAQSERSDRLDAGKEH